MAASASFTMNWRVTYNAFPKIILGMETLADSIVAKAALDIQAHAQTRAPVDTGRLKNSIQAYKVASAHWRVVVGAEYGVHVEWGTSRMAAQPYLQPAVNTVRPTFLDAMRQVCRP